ncbi:MAG: hypothetical protein Q7T61_15565 [Caulobacter sp.]|nr:hypothetical protein [Caulobacter sp.]
MDELTFHMTPDGDGLWRLHADLRTDAFSGKGWSWAIPDDLLAFAEQLSAYPILAESPATLRLVYDQGEGDDLRLKVQVRPFGSLGRLVVRVEIADPDDPSCRLKAKFGADYASIARWIPALRSLAAGRREEATLSGS